MTSSLVEVFNYHQWVGGCLSTPFFHLLSSDSYLVFIFVPYLSSLTSNLSWIERVLFQCLVALPKLVYFLYLQSFSWDHHLRRRPDLLEGCYRHPCRHPLHFNSL